MPSILDLPCELVAHVLSALDDITHLLSTILACRHFYASHAEHPAIKYGVIRRQLGRNLPYAITLLKLSRLEPGTQRIPDDITKLLDRLYYNPKNMKFSLRKLRLSDLVRMGRFLTDPQQLGQLLERCQMVLNPHRARLTPPRRRPYFEYHLVPRYILRHLCVGTRVRRRC